jgi:hypothetical protein
MASTTAADALILGLLLAGAAAGLSICLRKFVVDISDGPDGVFGALPGLRRLRPIAAWLIMRPPLSCDVCLSTWTAVALALCWRFLGGAQLSTTSLALAVLFAITGGVLTLRHTQ